MKFKKSHNRGWWGGFNNLGLCSTAIASVLNNVKTLSLPKVLLIMPLVMHEKTLGFLAKSNVRERQVAAFASMNPEFVVNFDKRYEESLVVSVNSIQFLIETGYVEFNEDVKIIKPFSIDHSFGKKATVIARATKNISSLLFSSEEELYLNLRVKL